MRKHRLAPVARFEVAARDQGAGVTYLEPSASQIGHKESIKDTARVLGRMFDGIEYRGFGQDVVEELAKYAGVPVFNGLTNEFHPTQMLADALTMREHSDKPLNQIAFAYVGDARYNMANSLLVLAAKLGMDVRIGAPKSLWPSENIIETVQAVVQRDRRTDSVDGECERSRERRRFYPYRCVGQHWVSLKRLGRNVLIC